LATLGGISISAVTLTCATLAELLFTRDFPTLGGLALATVLIAVPIQALSGLLACWVRTQGRPWGLTHAVNRPRRSMPVVLPILGAARRLP
jgi:hypothetical protein